MAQAANQHTPIKDLDDVLRYLTVELGYKKGVAVFMMNERYSAGDLRLERQDCIRDGEPYGGWIAIDAKFGYLKLDRKGHVRVEPRVKLWREARYRIAEGCDVRALFSPRPPAAQTAPDRQPEDKAARDPVDSIKRALSKSDRVHNILVDLDGEGRLGDDLQPNEIEKLVKPKYARDLKVPHRRTLGRVYKSYLANYLAKHPAK
jgi:hypothetical protein